MKEYTKNKWFKRIWILLIIVIMFNFVAPNIVKAETDEEGGDLFAPIASFIAGLGDLVIQFMQLIFTGDGQIGEEVTQVNEGVKDELALFTQAVRATECYGDLVGELGITLEDGYHYWLTAFADSQLLVPFINSYPAGTFEHGYSDLYFLGIEAAYSDTYRETWVNFIAGNGMIIDESDLSEGTDLAEIIARNGGGDKATIAQELEKIKIDESRYCLNIQMTDQNIQDYFLNYVENNVYDNPETTTTTVYSIKYGPANIFSGTIPAFDINFINPEHNTEDSSAVILRKNVSGWYQTLQKFAIVGLLPILVYIAIRMIISSTGKDKSKYKKMLMDWLVALCIIFILHYIMVFTLLITSNINEIFKAYTIDTETGADTQMSNLRNIIGDEEKWLDIWPEVLMYVILVTFSVTFSIQYLKRVIYMAFLTMIAPLIALTYPLDKIKDGQAQAFSMWIREYIFNALIQPLHLLLYAILVGGGVTLTETYPLYGVVAVGFLVPAEKFFRKMFGFDKAESVGTLGAVAGGAVLMSLIDKAKSVSIPKRHKGEHDEENSTIRTKRDPLEVLRTNNDSQTTATAQNSTNTTMTQNIAVNQNAQNILNSPNNINESTKTGENTRTIKKPYAGKALRFTGKVVKHVAKRTGQLTLGGAAGIMGLATTGSVKGALTYGAMGFKAGGAIANRATNSVAGLGKNAIKTAQSSIHTFRENAYGEEFTQFRESAEGEEIIRNYSRQEVQQCLAEGIENPSEMKKLLRNYKQVGSLEDAIKYHQMSQYCKKNGLNTAKDIEKTLMEAGFDEKQATYIRQNMEKF